MKKGELTKDQALKKDAKGEFYVDEEEGSYGVFGTESGFCYNLYSDKSKAEKEARRMTKMHHKKAMSTASLTKIQYKGALYVEAAVPAWKPGQPVPEGYRVVFGRLVKHDGTSDSYHDPSTKAWKATGTAKTVEDHEEAARLHRAASEAHSQAASDFARMGARSKEKKHMEAMKQHDSYAFKHDTGADWLKSRSPKKKKVESSLKVPKEYRNLVKGLSFDPYTWDTNKIGKGLKLKSDGRSGDGTTFTWFAVKGKDEKNMGVIAESYTEELGECYEVMFPNSKGTYHDQKGTPVKDFKAAIALILSKA